MHGLARRRVRVLCAPGGTRRALLIGLALSCASCDGKHDARDRAAAEDAGGDAGAVPELDAQSSSQDAASAADAPPGMDAAGDTGAASDASLGGEGGAPEAGTDAGPRTLRAQVCGDGGNWPAPLPPMGQRMAQPVGTQSFGFLEGPVWIAEQGVLLFSDMNFAGDDAQGPPARIRRLRPPASFDVFAEVSNGNGLALTNDGTLLAATHDNQGLSLFSLASAGRTPLTVRYEGKRFNSPNDLTVRSDGTVYFTDPDWQIGPRDSETMMTGVYRVPPPLSTSGTNAASLVEGTLGKPNGIALSPDERTLYVGSSGSEIWKYQVAADGSTSGRTKFAEPGSSDGMAVDCAGNLYVTSGVVEVFAPSGERLGEITLAGEPSNAAFGGADRKTLYITAGPRLYSIALNVPGFPY
jgi:gluconolactonase